MESRTLPVGMGFRTGTKEGVAGGGAPVFLSLSVLMIGPGFPWPSVRFLEATWGWEQVAGGDTQPDKMAVFPYTFSCYELIARICVCDAAELVPRAVPSPLGPARWGGCVSGSVPHTGCDNQGTTTLGSPSGPTVSWGYDATTL